MAVILFECHLIACKTVCFAVCLSGCLASADPMGHWL
uniref:Uncharacterized protein n=1 Tax=Rhizophora mucronata TaxID=61149 RepID=A0A2P2PDD9_RHIMU